jgi:hypothetical protein
MAAEAILDEDRPDLLVVRKLFRGGGEAREPSGSRERKRRNEQGGAWHETSWLLTGPIGNVPGETFGIDFQG